MQYVSCPDLMSALASDSHSIVFYFLLSDGHFVQVDRKPIPSEMRVLLMVTPASLAWQHVSLLETITKRYRTLPPCVVP